MAFLDCSCRQLGAICRPLLRCGRHSLPGGLPGVGYDYNELWGGLLRPEQLLQPPRKRENDENENTSALYVLVTLGLADNFLPEITSFKPGICHDQVYLNSKSGVAIIGHPPTRTSKPQPGDSSLRASATSVPAIQCRKPPAPPGIVARLMSRSLEPFTVYRKVPPRPGLLGRPDANQILTVNWRPGFGK